MKEKLPARILLKRNLGKACDFVSGGTKKGNDIRVLLYHKITNEPVSGEWAQMTTPAGLFEEHIKYLKDEGYESLFAEEIPKRLDPDKKSTQKTVCITFDDGYKDNFINAFPILKKYGFKATVFLTTNFVGEKSFSEEYLEWRDVLQMKDEGVFSFGCHSLSHRNLASLSESEFEKEIKTSKNILEEKLNTKIDTYAYPFGWHDSFNEKVIETLKKDGFSCAFTGIYGGNKKETNPYLLRRISVSRLDDVNELGKILRGSYDWYSIYQRIVSKPKTKKEESSVEGKKALPKGDFSITKMSQEPHDKLLEFNTHIYKDEFNNPRFSDKEKINLMWTWKWKENPASYGIENFGWLVKTKENIIGQFSAMPARVKIGKNTHVCAWGIDLAVRRDYRGMGVGTFIIGKVQEEARKSYKAFLIGGTNETSYHVFQKKGFVTLGRIPRYIKLLDTKTFFVKCGLPDFFAFFLERLLFLLGKPASFFIDLIVRENTIESEIIDNFTEEFNAFYSAVSKHYACITERNRPFLKWRHKEQPFGKSTIIRVKEKNLMKGFAVLREGCIKDGRFKGQKIGIISDILTDPESKKATRALIRAISDFFRKRKMFLVKCDILDSGFSKSLIGSGFILVPSKHKFLLDMKPESDDKKDFAMAALRKNWHITAADADLDLD